MFHGCYRKRWLALGLTLLATVAHAAAEAQPAAPAGFHGFAEGASEELIKRVNASQTRDYDAVLAEFDAYIATHAGDAIAAVERCRFIGYFASLEDVAIESASEQFDACIEALKDGDHADSAPVRLYLLEQEYGEQAIAKAELLLSESAEWTPHQQAALNESLANLYSHTNLIKAGPFAVRSIKLNPQSSVRLIASEYLIRIGAKAQALQTIQAMPQEKWNIWSLGEAVALLVSIDAATAANDLVDSNQNVKLDAGKRVLLARALFSAGKPDLARKILEVTDTSSKTQFVSLSTLRELFELERDHGSTETATTAYRHLRDKGYGVDPFAHHRLSLSLSHPSSPWQWKDALGIGALLLTLVTCMALPLLFVAPLHYRSVVKQLRGKLPQPTTETSPWSLKHLWYALAVLLTTGTVTSYVMAYPTFHAMMAVAFELPTQYVVLSSDVQLGNMMLISTTISLIALLPLLKKVNLSALLLGKWSAKRSVWIGIGSSITLLIAVGIARLTWKKFAVAGALGTDTTRAMQGIHASYGALALFIFVSGVVPLLEEFVFRGILLRTISRYYAAWIAMLLQAGIFMLWHEDPSTYPFIFSLALLAAYLARRSGGLLAPLVLHATNNAFAMGALLAASQSFKYLQ